jgi:hypothetical protein
MTFRAADGKTGVNYNTISRMASDFVPEMESVVKFARGFGEDVNAALVLAGYEPVGAAPAEASGYTGAYLQQLAAMKERLARDGISGPVPETGAHHGGTEGLTPEDAAAEIAWLEEMIRRGAGKR